MIKGIQWFNIDEKVQTHSVIIHQKYFWNYYSTNQQAESIFMNSLYYYTDREANIISSQIYDDGILCLLNYSKTVVWTTGQRG